MEQLTLKVVRTFAEGRLSSPWGRLLGWASAVPQALALRIAVVRRLRGLLEGFEISTREESAERRQQLAAARRNADLWKARNALCEEHIAVLEQEINSLKVGAIDLRARLVCLHGKLATTAATARYQSFTTALESRTEKA